ncbi:MAG: methyltransferase domain-containing protein [Syntrophobacteraceae bacterium]|jgi:putative methyltransferase (TIGR04325 family)
MKQEQIWRPNLASRLYSLKERIRPFVENGLNYLFSEMHYVPGGWRASDPAADGWKAEVVADAQEKHWPTLVRNLQGPEPLGVAHFPWSLSREDRTHHNVMMSYGYVLARAAGKKTNISILDWGGGAGHYYLYSMALLPEVAIDYHCFDVRGLCELGRRLLPEAQFYSDESDLRGKTFDLVVSSSSLHYFENWHETACKLASATREFLYIARLQTVLTAPSFVAVHRPNRPGYAELLSWCLNRREVVRCLEESGMELLREFVYAAPWAVRGAPEKAETRGFLFRPKCVEMSPASSEF